MKFIAFVVGHLLFIWLGDPSSSWKDYLIGWLIAIVIVISWSVFEARFECKKKMSENKAWLFATLIEAGIFAVVFGFATLIEAVFHL